MANMQRLQDLGYSGVTSHRFPCSRIRHEGKDAEGSHGLGYCTANWPDLAGASQIAASGVDCEGEDAKSHIDDDCVDV